MRWGVLGLLLVFACGDDDGGTNEAREPQATESEPEVVPAADEEVEQGPFLTPDDSPLEGPRPGAGPHRRRTLVVQSVGTSFGAPNAIALPGERPLFVVLDRWTLAVVDARRGEVLARRSLRGRVSGQLRGTDHSGRHVLVGRPPEACVWALDVDRVRCARVGNHAAIAGDGRKVYGMHEGKLVVWALREGRVNELAPIEGVASIGHLELSPSGSRIAMQVGNDVHLVNAETGETLRVLAANHLPFHAFRPAGGSWVTWAHGALRFRDVATGALRKTVELETRPLQVDWSPGSHELAVVQGRTLHRFSGTSGEPQEPMALEADRVGHYVGGAPGLLTARQIPRAGGWVLDMQGEAMSTFTLGGGDEEARELSGGLRGDVVLAIENGDTGLRLWQRDASVSLHDAATSLRSYGNARAELGGAGEAHHDEDDEAEEPFNELENGGWVFPRRTGRELIRVDAISGKLYRGDDVLPMASVGCELEGAVVRCGATTDRLGDVTALRTLSSMTLFTEAPQRFDVLDDCEGSPEPGEECCGGAFDRFGVGLPCGFRGDEEARATDTHVLFATGDGAVWLYDRTSGRQVRRIAPPVEEPRQAWDFDPSGSRLVLSRGGRVRIEDVASGESTADSRLQWAAKWVRWTSEGLLLSTMRDELVWLDEALEVKGRWRRRGFRADDATKSHSALCDRGTLRWVENRPDADDGRELGRCEPEAWMTVAGGFIAEVRGEEVVFVRINDGKRLHVAFGTAEAHGDDRTWIAAWTPEGKWWAQGVSADRLLWRTDRPRFARMQAVTPEEQQADLLATFFAQP